MTTTIKAKYKNGVLEPLSKIDLPDGVEVTVHFDNSPSEMDEESREWLNAGLAGELPPYDWGKGGMPKGKPVRYDRDAGLVVEEV